MIKHFHIQVQLHVFAKSRIFKKYFFLTFCHISETITVIYRNVLYLILILLKNWFDHILYMFPVKLIFHDLWAKAQVYIFIPQTFLQNQEFLKNIFFKLLVISQKLWKLQRRVIHHFNSLKELIWPYVMHNYCKIDISWLISQNFFMPQTLCEFWPKN